MLQEIVMVDDYSDKGITKFGLVWFVSSTGQTCPEGRSTNRTQVLCEVLHPTLSRKTREIDHNTGNYVPYVPKCWAYSEGHLNCYPFTA